MSIGYFNRIVQNVQADVNNSSITNLAQNAYFIGLPTSTLGVAAIKIAFKCDQNCNIFIDQSRGAVTGIGTVTTTAASATITGSAATKFTRDFKVGDQIFIVGETTHYILSITSDTVMTATATFAGAVAAAYTFYAWDQTDQYTYNTTTDNFGLTIQAVNVYERVRITNIGSALSLVFRLSTVLCPIVEALPRSLDENGNLKVSSPTDEYGFSAENTPQNEQRSISPVKLVGVSFEGNTLDTNFWSTILQAGGTVTQQNGRLDMLTNTTANGSAVILSFRRARYVIGSANMFIMEGRFGDTGTTNNTRQFGTGLGTNYNLTVSSVSVVAGDVYTDVNGVQYTVLITETTTTPRVFATGTPTAGVGKVYTRVSGGGAASMTGSGFTVDATLTDGYYFQLSGAVFSVGTIIGGSPTLVNSGLFNGVIGATYTVDTNMHTWEIYYNTKTVWFVIDGKLLHTILSPLTPLSNTQSLFAFMKNANSSNATANVGLYSRSLSIRRLGLLESEKNWKYISTNTTTVCKYSAGRLNKVIFGDPDSAQIVTLYDGLSVAAPIIAILTNVASGNQHSKFPHSIDFGMPFHNGLTVVTSVNAVPVTIIYE